MSQFTVYKNEDKATKKTYPYFLNIQNNLLDELNSRVVMPFSTLASVKHRDARKLLLRHSLILGYTDLSLYRASLICICQSTPR